MRALSLAALIAGSVALSSPAWGRDTLTFNHLSTYETGAFDEGAAEIVAYSVETQKLFVVNADAGDVDVLDISNPASPTKVSTLSTSAHGKGANSVAVHGGLVAVAVVGQSKQDPGKVVFFDLDGNEQGSVTVGANPDMVTFTPDGAYALVANEGEPSRDYTNDPEGTVSVITIADMAARTADFSGFETVPEGMRIVKPGSTVAADVEPEYIAVSADGKTAYVTLQENNGIAVVDVAKAEITNLLGLGYKDHSQVPLDASNKDGGANIKTWPVMGMYQPDSIVSFEVAGQTYLMTANEGDAKDYDGWSEETRVAKLTLDPTAFPNADMLQENGNLGRLKTTTSLGDTDGDGDHDVIYSYGARSFSIWSTSGELVFDSADQFERMTAARLGGDFNSTNDENDKGDSRSDDKGPEPEALTVGQIGGKTIAFIGLERVGGIMAYDVTDPANAEFLGYNNNRDFSGNAEAGKAGDLGPEGMAFIPAAQSPNGKDLLAVANEVSGTTSIFEIVLN
ncbi:choice-of-anchor I family protein [Parvibaculaceae bacterium PLY_AMNH_Bact1]|nr:choice-of-anchor I family protein [Parvibaculaceae bacterium PLY_AMNH_Bact1]